MNPILILAALIAVANLGALFILMQGGNVAHAALFSVFCLVAAISLAVAPAVGGAQ